ncbi:MAG: ATP-binding cassette domain-containing protein, partial [Leptospiraceae bacterium]|nr:ATP-binding cassette domain-containing protein [Leptospiraceae bacterium]
MNSLLKIQNLNIIHTQSGKTILRDFRISLQRGRIHAVIGESGSGKTTLALLLFKLSHPDLNYYYDVFTLLNREYKDISKKEWLNLRGKNIILIPQNPANAFHPYRKVGVQIKEYFYLKDKKLANKPFILHILEEI